MGLYLGHPAWGCIPRRRGVHERPFKAFVREAPRSGPFFDDLTLAKSAKELKEHLETSVL